MSVRKDRVKESFATSIEPGERNSRPNSTGIFSSSHCARDIFDAVLELVRGLNSYGELP